MVLRNSGRVGSRLKPPSQSNDSEAFFVFILIWLYSAQLHILVEISGQRKNLRDS